MAANDGSFKLIGAKLATTSAPGKDPDDTASYILKPGIDFMRPWLGIRGGIAFQWPLGIEGLSLTIDPKLGIHTFIGDNAVTVDVIHAGEEHFTMTGNFPGLSAPDLVGALRDIVYKGAPEEGKILWLPGVVTYAQRVQVTHFEAARTEDTRGFDMTYSIDFVRVGTLNSIKLDPALANPKAQPTTKPNKGASTKSMNVDATHNTLRKIAQWKLGSASKWLSIYDLNGQYFQKQLVPALRAPDLVLPLGMKVFLP